MRINAEHRHSMKTTLHCIWRARYSFEGQRDTDYTSFTLQGMALRAPRGPRLYVFYRAKYGFASPGDTDYMYFTMRGLALRAPGGSDYMCFTVRGMASRVQGHILYAFYRARYGFEGPKTTQILPYIRHTSLCGGNTNMVSVTTISYNVYLKPLLSAEGQIHGYPSIHVECPLAIL